MLATSTLLRPLALALPAAALLVSCSDSNRTANTAATPPVLDRFTLADWNVTAEGGAENPRLDNGRVRLESVNAAGASASVRLESKVQGKYSDFESQLTLAHPPTANEPTAYGTFLAVGIDALTETPGASPPQRVARLARIGLVANDAAVRLVTQILDADGNPLEQRVRQIGVLAAVEGSDGGEDGGGLLDTPIHLRIAVDRGEQVVRFSYRGALEYTYVPTSLTLPRTSTLAVEAYGRRFLVFAEKLRATDDHARDPVVNAELSSVGPKTQAPGRVQFLFTLRDENDAIVSLPADQLLGDRLSFTEDGRAIDRAEAHPIFKPANLPQDVVLVLDYTESMNRSGGVAPMVAGAKSLADAIWTANGQNRVQIFAFHDSFVPVRNLVPNPNQAAPEGNWLAPSKKTAAFEAIDRFAPYHGFSRVFDAVDTALGLAFSQSPREAVRSLVFLTDGNDTGSSTSIDELVREAASHAAKLYPIAVNAAETEKRQLRRIAADAGGAHYEVTDTARLTQTFHELGGDLGSLYSASYTSSAPPLTPRTIGLDLAIPRPNASGGNDTLRLRAPITSTLPAIPTGDTTVGMLQFQQVPSTTGSVVRISALFVPRNVDRFAIKFENLPAGVSAATRLAPSGLIKGWNPVTRDTAGFDTTSGPARLQFGDFGEWLEVTFSYANPPANFTARVTINNQIHTSARFRNVAAGGSFDAQGNFTFDLPVTRPE